MRETLKLVLRSLIVFQDVLNLKSFPGGFAVLGINQFLFLEGLAKRQPLSCRISGIWLWLDGWLAFWVACWLACLLINFRQDLSRIGRLLGIWLPAT